MRAETISVLSTLHALCTKCLRQPTAMCLILSLGMQLEKYSQGMWYCDQNAFFKGHTGF